MEGGRRSKCPCCQELFRPDPRNIRHQRYCAKPACRSASHRASQQRWLSKPDNHHYFRGPEHVARVQAWRQTHPGYWRRSRAQSSAALQDDCLAQPIETAHQPGSFAQRALQEVLADQPTVLIGLIAHLTDSPLQDDIASTSRRLLQLGQDILSGKPQSALQGTAPSAGV
jgi:hypothetical protein